MIVTHMHWDHAGNYDLFPNARYHVQDTEMAYATGRCMCHQTLRIPFSESDVHAMVRKVYAYRCRIPRRRRGARARHHRAQDRRPLEGPAMRAGEDQARHVVVASDCIHLYSHIDEGRVFPITYSVGDTLEGYKTIQKLASSRQHIVPGHDPEVLKIYPAAKPGLEDWVAGWMWSRRFDVPRAQRTASRWTASGTRRATPTPTPRTPSL